MIFRPLASCVLHPSGNVLLVPKFLEHLHDLGIGPAVQASRKRSHARCHAGIHMGPGGNDLAAGKRGGIEGVVGMEHQDGVEIAGDLRIGLVCP